MPLTPFHLGPGAAVKAIMPRHFSFSIFCFAQVVTDSEVAWYLLRGEYPIHRWLHTFIGATAVAALSVIVGRPVCQLLLRRWLAQPKPLCPRFRPLTWRITPTSALTAALIGTYSHVLLDSVVHADARPFRPWSHDNPFLHPAWSPLLHAVCVILGLVAACYVAMCSAK